jgi:hypothetical protein
MSSCKIDNTGEVCQVNSASKDAKGDIWLNVTDSKGQVKEVRYTDVVPVTQESTFERMAKGTGTRSYSQKSCEKMPKTSSLYRFEKSKVTNMPCIPWDLIGYCVLTDVNSLDLFGFNAADESMFQSKFSEYDIKISYALEGANHYICVQATDNSILEFKSWVAMARTSKPEIKNYISPDADQLELYKSHKKTLEAHKSRVVQGHALMLPFPLLVDPRGLARGGLQLSAGPLLPYSPRLVTPSLGAAPKVAAVDRTKMFSIIPKKTSRF